MKTSMRHLIAGYFRQQFTCCDGKLDGKLDGSGTGNHEGIVEEPRFHQWQEVGHQFEAGELETLKRSIVEMALSRIDGPDELYLGG